MVQRKKAVISDERKLRNITDYILDSIKRLFEHAGLLSYIKKHGDYFIDPVSKESVSIIRSIVDVYSRDTIIILINILDYDRQTSSLFTLLDYIKDNKIKSRYLLRLKRIKKSLNEFYFVRGNLVAHFNTKTNIHEKGLIPVNRQMQANPDFIKKITKRIEILLWDMKEELCIEGVFGFHLGEPLDRSFARLIGKELNRKKN